MGSAIVEDFISPEGVEQVSDKAYGYLGRVMHGINEHPDPDACKKETHASLYEFITDLKNDPLPVQYSKAAQENFDARHDAWCQRRMTAFNRHLKPGEDLVLTYGRAQMWASMLYVFNVQQLFPPKDGGKSQATGQEAQRRKTWRWQEEYGSLMDHLRSLDDLVVIVDEAHLFGSTAKVYRSALEELLPQATMGLTASPGKKDDIVYRYPLWRAISDGYVKQPVLVYRNSGYDSEERQLQDAMSLLALKEKAYAWWRAAHPDAKATKPLLFVVCSDVAHASETAARLRTATFTGSDLAVLQVDNEHDDAATQNLLRYLDAEHSPVRVIVSVNKLREGWDTKRIAVMCTLRAMGTEVLTQQVMGRGLRLPFGELTGVGAIDELDIISHKSFVSLLKTENVLREFGIDSEERVSPEDILPRPGTGHDPNPQAGTGPQVPWPGQRRGTGIGGRRRELAGPVGG